MIPIPGLLVVALTTLMLVGGPVEKQRIKPLTGAKRSARGRFSSS
jgi:hypothetical protein